ncbi:hypothetical protein [Catellatospora tritici]|uniref:hypothetical protein n=1 Tax=Catellatospora tritici TaxID=2851566 RepID=UPI001C2D3CAD|nr:hypothetical protein [Catellatospora tritici]MBV1856364.1 hypothetical protein [Catellatospora tritici]
MRFLGPQSVAFWTVVGGVCAVLALVVAVLQWQLDAPRAPTAAGSAATPTAGADDLGQSPSPAGAGVEWRGQFALPLGGQVNLDSSPPFAHTDTVEGADLTYTDSGDGPELHQRNLYVAVAVWQNATEPGAAQCRQAVRAKSDPWVRAEVGRWLCVETTEPTIDSARTSEYRTVALRITMVEPDRVVFDAVRWAD